MFLSSQLFEKSDIITSNEVITTTGYSIIQNTDALVSADTANKQELRLTMMVRRTSDTGVIFKRVCDSNPKVNINDKLVIIVKVRRCVRKCTASRIKIGNEVRDKPTSQCVCQCLLRVYVCVCNKIPRLQL